MGRVRKKYFSLTVSNETFNVDAVIQITSSKQRHRSHGPLYTGFGTRKSSTSFIDEADLVQRVPCLPLRLVDELRHAVARDKFPIVDHAQSRPIWDRHTAVVPEVFGLVGVAI